MKRTEVINTISWMIADYKGDLTLDDKIALRVLSYLEDIGMQPPVCSVTIKDGKHTPAERRWDDEDEA